MDDPNNPQQKGEDSSGDQKSRGHRHHHHRRTHNNPPPSSGGGGRGGYQRHGESRDNYRARDEDQDGQPSWWQNGATNDGRYAKPHEKKHNRHQYESRHHSESHRQNSDRHHKHDKWRNNNDEDPIAKEKEANKLSLLDGIEEMYKKPHNQFPAFEKTASPEPTMSGNSSKHKFLEENQKTDAQFADNSRPLKWFSTRGQRNYFGKEGTYRSYPDEVPEQQQYHQQQGGNSSYDSGKYKREYRPKHYHKHNYNQQPVQPSAPMMNSEDRYYQDSGGQVEDRSYRNYRGNTRKPFRQDAAPSDHNKTYHSNSSHNSHTSKKRNFNQKVTVDDDATQREMLTEQLQSGEFECMVCCEAVRHRDSVWSCIKCFNIFHLHCVRKWARTPTAIVEGQGWRCPTCQDIYESIPHNYYCFCGKVRDPDMSRHDTPHSCGKVCGRARVTKDCQHHCNILCHPGPCPPCSAMVTRTCECKKIEMQIKCGRTTHLTCDGICQKPLNCELHKCRDKCHGGPCEICTETVKQDCFCGKTSREVPCTQETSGSSLFACDQLCNKQLSCGNHNCKLTCHSGACPPCVTLPGVVTMCPCGKSSVKELLGGVDRKQCTEPIPVCRKTCDKLLKCGPDESRHNCYSSCHTGPCPKCPLKTEMNCLCGSLSKEFRCSELDSVPILQCEKRCNRKKLCGRHKCLNTCCVDYEHVCELTCNRKLTCALHQCPEPCHKGNCRTCTNVSFEDLTCYCGLQVVMAPIACGTRPPECNQICVKQHACEHPVQHNCHSEEQCPPCTALTEKWCFGGHEKRNHVPCYLTGLSCGLPCTKRLSCGQHFCQKVCHEGVCELETDVLCTQPCVRKRLDCDHNCGAPCHIGVCPTDYPCKMLIPVSCKCGTRTEDVPCSENVKLFKQLSASMLASKMQDIQLGNSVDISDVLGSGSSKKKLRRIECNEECSLIERNRRLALALQIRNPDLSTNPGPPKYSDFLKDESKKNPVCVKQVYDKLTELVQLAKQSKQKSRSHSFPPMNRDLRRIVHELSDYFGCDSESFDQEPKRNVVVTAFRDRSYLPSCSVLTIVQREMGMRKVPLPVMTTLRPSGATKSNESSLSSTHSSEENKSNTIDYFDF